jgi:hypothetical protein
MKRRTLLQSIASVFALVASGPFSRLRLFAQAPVFATADIDTLKAVSEVVLPTALGKSGRDAVVDRFNAWFVNYRVGAERGYGYGNSQLTAPTPALNTSRYAAQLAALEKAARDQGAASLAALAVEKRRPIIESALNDPQPVSRLGARPTGANVVGDLMGFYFSSPEAYDLAYNAEIGRDTCRGLDGSEQAPAPKGGR